MKRKLLLVVSLMLALSLSIGGTIAYLTDTDSDVNVMTLGDIKIEQIELQRVEGVDYRNGGEIADGDELEPFVQGQPLFPSYTDDESDYSAKTPDDEQFWWGPYVTSDLTHENGASNGLFDDGLKGAMDKFVFVQNTGSSPAYYRTWIALECPDSLRYHGDTVAEADLWINVNMNSRFEWTEEEYVDIDGTRFLVFCATYLKELPAGEISRPSLLQVALTGTADSEDIEALGDTYTILTFTQAVQTNNLPDAKTALAAAFGEPTADNHPWGDADVMPTVYVTTPEEMMDALGNGGTIIAPANTEMLIESEEAISVDANGATVVMNGDGAESGRYGYLGFIPTAGENVDVSNLKVTGNGFVELGHYGLGGGTYTATNLVIEDMAATLAITDASRSLTAAFAHYGTATLTDCVMTGTTNYKEGYTPYDLGCVHDTTTTINGGEYGSIYMWNRATVSIYDAEVGQIDAGQFVRTNSNAQLTIGAGTHVGTLNLICASNRVPKVVIEDDAVVDQIVFDGQTYTQAEWLAR